MLFAKYYLERIFYLANREDFLALLEKQYLIKTPHPSLRATFPHRGRLIS